MTNILRWWNLRDDNLSLSMDYVHNICSNGWSLGTIGTTIFKEPVHLQPIFVPLCYSFTRTESSVPYVAAISQIIMVIHLATGTNIETIKQRIPLVQGDDAGTIKKAAKDVLNADFYGCYAHAVRSVAKKSVLLNYSELKQGQSCKSYFLEEVLPDLQVLSSAGSHPDWQYTILKEKFFDKLVNNGHYGYVEYLHNTYFKEEGAAERVHNFTLPPMGIPRSTQSHERANGTIRNMVSYSA